MSTEPLFFAGEPQGAAILDTSESRPSFLLETANGRFVRLSPSAYEVLRLTEQAATPAEAAQALSRAAGRAVSVEEAQAAYRSVRGRVSAVEAKERGREPGFFLRVRLIPAALVGRLARLLAPAFAPSAAAALLAVVALAAALVPPGEILRLPPLSSVWWAYGLLVVSLLAHEMGHAAACARFGARPHDIGFALYLIYPAFYSDVSAAWALKRWQRVLVDLGGIYFQLVAGALYALAFVLTGWEPLRLAVALVLGTCVFAINPIFRFDGYWVMADALGVTNLGEQPRRVAGWLADRLRGRQPRPLPWPAPVAAALVLYSLFSLFVWGAFLALVPRVLWRQAAAFPASAWALGRDLVADPSAVTLARVNAFLVAGFALFVMGLMLYRLAAPLVARAARAFVKRPAAAP